MGLESIQIENQRSKKKMLYRYKYSKNTWILTTFQIFFTITTSLWHNFDFFCIFVIVLATTWLNFVFMRDPNLMYS